MMQKTALCLLFCTLLINTACKKKDTTDGEGKSNGTSARAVSQEDLLGEADPMANPQAVPGGTYLAWGAAFPKSLNMWIDYNRFSINVMEMLFEPLIELHSKENRPVGLLAEAWEISEDKKVFTFTIYEQAKWSDGTPVTAEDVQFYWDVIMNPKNMTPLFRVGLDRFERPEVVNAKTIRIRAKELHWRNFYEAGWLFAFPKHIWKDKDFNKLNFEFKTVSGPYKLGEVKKDRYLILKRRDDWWGRTKRYNQYKYNFNQIKYKFMNDPNKVLEAFKKGDIDVFRVNTATHWIQKTGFEAVKKGWVVKQKIFNKEPLGFQGFVINLRKNKFQDVRVRRALFHLLNREKINEKLMYNQYFLSNSYYPDLHPQNQNPEVPLVKFDPEKARALLKAAGWIVNQKGRLEKDGEVFTLTFMTAQEDLRHTNVYVEDLKAVGITAKIEKLSWSTIRKRIHKFDFDMYWTAWGSVRLRDPEASWHSRTANEEASNNVPGVKDAVVDSLIEVQKQETDLDKRMAILKALDKRLNEIVPYVLLWGAGYHRLLYWNKFGTPVHVLAKFLEPGETISRYWWFDPEKLQKLQDAKKTGKPLELQPVKIHYTDAE
jgi:microcin C transport system substrate-binding protein